MEKNIKFQKTSSPFNNKTPSKLAEHIPEGSIPNAMQGLVCHRMNWEINNRVGGKEQFQITSVKLICGLSLLNSWFVEEFICSWSLLRH